MIKKINLEKLLVFFVLMQPFLDFYLLYSETVTNVFKFSPTTIIRILFIGLFLIYILFKIKYNKKYLWLLGYLIFVLIYSVFHIFNSLKFDINIGNNYTFSFITEAFYFIRMFIPIILIFITYTANIKEKYFKRTIISVSLIFSLVIIVTNIFKVSLTSYDGDNIILGNIFDWFLDSSYKFEELASKGFFYSANQISAVLILLLPINIYYAIKASQKTCVLSTFSLCLSMIMIGTRVGVYGWFLIAIAVFVTWVFFSLIHKNKIAITYKKIIVYLALFIILTFFTINSPLVLRETNTDFAALEEKNITKEIREQLYSVTTQKEKENFIIKHCEKFSIPYVYTTELYEYKNDANFWIDTMKLPYSVRGGNRNLQNLITRRIYELNYNALDKYLGMGYSRFRNAKLYIEQDYIVHFYTLGIFGIVLLVLPSVFVATYALIYMIVKKRFRMKTTILCMSIYLVNCISIFSGHTLDELIVTIILGFICGYILILLNENKSGMKVGVAFMNNKNYDEKNPYVSVIVPVYNVEKYIEKCLDSLVNQTLKNIEIIVVNDGTKDNSQEIVDKYVKEYSNVRSYIKENGGLSSARNFGLEHAKGKYIAFVDSDDWVELDMYEQMYTKAISNNFDLVVSDLKYVYSDKNVNAYSNIEKDIYGKEDLKLYMTKIYPAAWNKLYKRELFNTNIRFKLNVWFEDVEFIYKLYPYITSIGVVNKPLYNYLQRDGAITSTFDKRLYHYVENWDGIIEFYKKNKLYKKYKEELEYSHIRYLFATFIKRLANINNKEEFNYGVNLVIDKINKNYPNYKKNKYINKLNSKSLYLKYFNKRIANIIYFLKNKSIKG